jgi:hypothetical protein
MNSNALPVSQKQYWYCHDCKKWNFYATPCVSCQIADLKDPNPNPTGDIESWRCTVCMSWMHKSRDNCFQCNNYKLPANAPRFDFSWVNKNDSNNPFAFRCPVCTRWSYPYRRVCYNIDCYTDPQHYTQDSTNKINKIINRNTQS